MDFSALDASIASLSKAAAKYNEARLAMTSTSPEKLKAINAEITLAERKFLYEKGLPRRPWTQNILYAPGWFTGYGVKTMPGIREGIEDGRYPEAVEQMAIVANAIQNEATLVDKIAGEMAGQ